MMMMVMMMIVMIVMIVMMMMYMLVRGIALISERKLVHVVESSYSRSYLFVCGCILGG
jgi:hypothetical protein